MHRLRTVLCTLCNPIRATWVGEAMTLWAQVWSLSFQAHQKQGQILKRVLGVSFESALGFRRLGNLGTSTRGTSGSTPGISSPLPARQKGLDDKFVSSPKPLSPKRQTQFYDSFRLTSFWILVRTCAGASTRCFRNPFWRVEGREDSEEE